MKIKLSILSILFCPVIFATPTVFDVKKGNDELAKSPISHIEANKQGDRIEISLSIDPSKLNFVKGVNEVKLIVSQPNLVLLETTSSDKFETKFLIDGASAAQYRCDILISDKNFGVTSAYVVDLGSFIKK